MRHILCLLRWGGRLLLLAYFVAATLLLVLRYNILPRIDEWRPEIVAAATSRLGVPIHVGRIEADWSGLRPRLHLQEVELGAGQGDSLRLARVDAVLSWQSLLRLRPDFHRLELYGPNLMLRRDVDGRLHVAGVVVPEGTEVGAGEGEGAALDWLLGQRELVIRHARVRWLDQLRAAPELVLDDVNFRLLAGGGRYRFGFTARPPAALASTVDLRGELRGRDPARPRTWTGDIYAALDGGDLGGLKPWLEYPLPVTGAGGGRLWLRIADGRIANGLADVALRDVAVQLAPELPPLALKSVDGRFSGADGDGSRQLSAQGLRLILADGSDSGLLEFSLRHQAAGWSRAASTQLRLNRVSVAWLSRLAPHLPMEAAQRQYVAALAPSGVVSNVELQWDDGPAEPAGWQLAARFEDLSLEPVGAVPGVHGLSGEVHGNDTGGRWRLRGRDMSLDFPHIFADARVPLTTLEAEGGWGRDGKGLAIQLDSARFGNGDASGSAHGYYRVIAGGPGEIDLQARLDKAKGTAVWRYMPLVVNEETRHWLQHSIIAGTALDAELRLKGDLAKFPFTHDDGTFLITARITDARLDYAEGWPVIDNIQGALHFEGASMRITARRAAIFGAGLSEVEVGIPVLGSGDEILEVQGKAAGPTVDFLRYVSASPIAERIGHFTDGMHAEGKGRLDLRMDMPLHRVNDTRVDGTYRFSGNRLRLVEGLPVLSDVAGSLRFTAQSLSIPSAKGRFLGEPVEVTAVTDEQGLVHFQAKGAATAAAARQELTFPLLQALDGRAAWQADVDVLHSGARVRVRSTLEGAGSDLPYPLSKAAGERWPLDVQLDFPGGGRNEVLSASVGEVVRLQLERDPNKGQVWGEAGGGIGVLAPLRTTDDGVMLAAELKQLDIDAWRKVLGAAGGSTPTAGSPALPLVGAAVRVGELQVAGQTVKEFDLRAVAGGEGWKGRLKSANAAGEFAWDAQGKGRLTARFDHLVMEADPEPDAIREAAEAREEEGPRSLPELDIRVKDFVLRGIPLGRLELQARNRASGRWELDALRLETAKGQFVGQGFWQARSPQQTRLNFTLDTPDAGGLLSDLGYAEAMQHGNGRLEGTVSWAGAPTRIDYPSLGGSLQMDVKEGQFRKLDPGMGRLLGVLSLQALPRRITLDFRDVFSEGFAFDRISGTIKIASGVMRTDDLQIRGPAARVFMRGSADVPAETQDLLVTVQPTLSESVAIGAAAGLINPVAGVVTYLAQKVLSDPIEKLFSFEYTVTGAWVDPKVEKLTQQRPPAAGGVGNPAQPGK